MGLRDTLNITVTKFGCGMALCGACMVHVNGDGASSCITPISSVVGKKVCGCGTYQRIRKAIHRAASTATGKAHSAA